jgi:hypothetical protein
VLLALGVGLAALGAAYMSAIATVLGLAALTHGIHTFGRLGTDTHAGAGVVRRRQLSNVMVLGALAFGLGVGVLADGRLGRALAASSSPDLFAGVLVAAVAAGGGGIAALLARKRLHRLGTVERRPREVEKA